MLVMVVLAFWGCHEAAGTDDPTGDGGTDVVGSPAPDFTLEDLNPGSPTHGDDRSVSGQRGKVLLIYFANYT